MENEKNKLENTKIKVNVNDNIEYIKSIANKIDNATNYELRILSSLLIEKIIVTSQIIEITSFIDTRD